MSGRVVDCYAQGRQAAFAHFIKHAEGGRAAAMKNFFTGVKDRAVRFGEGQLDAAKGLFKGVHGGLGINMDPDISARAHEILSDRRGMQWDTLADMQRAAHRAEALKHLKKLTPTLLTGAGAYGVHKALKLKGEIDQQREMQRAQEQMLEQHLRQQQYAPVASAPYGMR